MFTTAGGVTAVVAAFCFFFFFMFCPCSTTGGATIGVPAAVATGGAFALLCLLAVVDVDMMMINEVALSQ